MTKSIQPIDWAALGANLGSTLLFTLLLLSPFLWGATVWHWLLAVGVGLVLGVYFYIRRERFEEPGPDADETRCPADRRLSRPPTRSCRAACGSLPTRLGSPWTGLTHRPSWYHPPSGLSPGRGHWPCHLRAMRSTTPPGRYGQPRTLLTA